MIGRIWVRVAAAPVAAKLALSGFAGWLIGGGMYLAIRPDKGAVLGDLTLLALPYAVAAGLMMLRNWAAVAAGIAMLALPTAASLTELARVGWLSGFGGTLALNAVIAAFALAEIVAELRTSARPGHPEGTAPA